MPSKKTAAAPAIERIREIAYQLWLEAGEPHGDDAAHWFAAETLAAGEIANQPSPAKKKAAPRKKAA